MVSTKSARIRARSDFKKIGKAGRVEIRVKIFLGRVYINTTHLVGGSIDRSYEGTVLEFIHLQNFSKRCIMNGQNGKNIYVKFSADIGIKGGALKYNLEGEHSRFSSLL